MPQLIVNTGANGWLLSTNPSMVQPHTTQLEVGTQTFSTRRALLRFSLAELPAEAQVDSVTLQLWQQGGALPNPSQAIYRTKSSWEEAQATWNSRRTGQPWIYAGGDYFSSPSAVLQPAQSTEPGGEYIQSDVTALVQLDVGTDAVNLLIRNASESSETGLVLYDPFAGAHPPILTIQYGMPASGRERLLLGMGVGL